MGRKGFIKLICNAFKREPEISFAICAAAIIAAVYLISLPVMRNLRDVKLQAATSALKQNTFTIQLAVERYGTDFDGYYPQDLSLLISKGYLPAMPENPYFGLVESAPLRIEQVPPGVYKPGCVVYLPYRSPFDGDYDETGWQSGVRPMATGYILVCLGWQVDGRQDEPELAAKYRGILTNDQAREASQILSYGRR